MPLKTIPFIFPFLFKEGGGGGGVGPLLVLRPSLRATSSGLPRTVVIVEIPRGRSGLRNKDCVEFIELSLVRVLSTLANNIIMEHRG